MGGVWPTSHKKRSGCAMNKPPVANYRLEQIDDALWKRVKSRAAYEGRTVRFVLIELLKVYAAHGFTVVDTFRDRKGKNGSH